MSCGDDPCDAIREEFADAVAQAIEMFTARVVTATYASIRAEGQRNYLEIADIESIQQFVAATTVEHRWPPPSLAAIVETCRRMNVPVVTEN